MKRAIKLHMALFLHKAAGRVGCWWGATHGLDGECSEVVALTAMSRFMRPRLPEVAAAGGRRGGEPSAAGTAIGRKIPPRGCWGLARGPSCTC